MQHKVVKNVLVINTIAILFAVVIVSFFVTDDAKAASLANVSITLDRMQAGVVTGATVCARPIGAGTESTVAITFPAGFALAVAGSWTVNTTILPPNPAGYTVAAWPGILTATNVTGQTVTFPSSDLTPGTIIYCFTIHNVTTEPLTNATAGIDKVGTIATNIDTSTFALAILTGSDQIGVTATVPPNFSFALSSNSLTFASLSTTVSSTTTPSTGTIVTNASNGWVVWVKDLNNGTLTSASTGANIPAAGTYDNATTSLTAANYGFGLNVSFTDSATGTGTASQALNFGQEYADAVSSAGRLENVFHPIAASSGTTDGDTVVMTPRARVTAVQQAAADYTDTITVVAAGRF
jgi:hypothetical protein